MGPKPQMSSHQHSQWILLNLKQLGAVCHRGRIAAQLSLSQYNHLKKYIFIFIHLTLTLNIIS
jgi:hypothetical protein